MAGKKEQLTCAFCGNTPSRKRDVFFIPSMYEGLAICSDCIERAGEIFADAQNTKDCIGEKRKGVSVKVDIFKTEKKYGKRKESSRSL